MAFHEVRFPDNISRGARGGPERRTQIVELASGDEERNASWANSRRRYDVAYGIRRADDLATVVAFFEARNGRLHGFRFKDWTGELRPIAGLDRRLREASRLGFRRAIVPIGRGVGAPEVPGIEVVSVATLRDAVGAALGGGERSGGGREGGGRERGGREGRAAGLEALEDASVATVEA